MAAIWHLQLGGTRAVIWHFQQGLQLGGARAVIWHFQQGGVTSIRGSNLLPRCCAMQLRAADERMRLLGGQMEQERARHAQLLASQEEQLVAQAEHALAVVQVGGPALVNLMCLPMLSLVVIWTDMIGARVINTWDGGLWQRSLHFLGRP
jgi:hypothetical protein